MTNRMKRTNLLSSVQLSFMDMSPSRRGFEECSCGPNTDHCTDFGEFPKSAVAEMPFPKSPVA